MPGFVPGIEEYGWLSRGGNKGVLGGLTPVFRALGNGSITPEIGTAGTFTRAAIELYPNAAATIAQAGSGSPCIPAFAPGLTTTNGGLYVTGALTNLLVRSNEFDNASWAKNGLASVVANQDTGPQGNLTADQIIGTTALDGVQQVSASTAASNTWVFGVWLRAGSGTRTVDLVIKDQNVTPQASTVVHCSVTTTWKFFKTMMDFVSATGNVVVEIDVNDTTGYAIYASEAVLHSVDSSTGNGMMIDFDLLQNVTTTSATASATLDQMIYAGTEITASRPLWTWNVWAYVPNFTDAEVWNDKFIFAHYNNGTGYKAGAKISASDAKLNVSFGSNSFNTTAVALNKGAWNLITLTANYASTTYKAYLNGTQIYNPALSRAEGAANGMIVGAHALSPANQLMWNSIVGLMELYDTDLSATDVSGLFASQKSGYGL